MARVVSNRIASVGQPLTLSSFLGSFTEIWEKQGLERDLRRPVPIGKLYHLFTVSVLMDPGVCVSGGPDSMALAYLLNQISAVPGKHNIAVQPFAFIVNHNARKESTEEAHWVRSQLCRLGVESRIFEIQWPNTNDPGSTTDFEMTARRARYRLIADAAIQKNINHLFLGHHQDDQVETILMRLVRNAGTSFLGWQGMSEHSKIPCCDDIRGANEAENYEKFADWLRPGEIRLDEEEISPEPINRGKNVTPSLPGGLLIHRPLLPFRKSAILDFCNTNRVTYVQDKTNYDPTLTIRNAVRYMRSHYVLPKALQAPSILELRKSSQRSAASLARRGDKILRGLRVLSIDLRSGRMTVLLSSAFVPMCEADPEAGAYALARLTSVVSPQSKDDEPTLVPQHNLKQFIDKNRSRIREQMTIRQVLLEKADSRPYASKNSVASSFELRGEVNFGKDLSDERETVWTLSRPPMRLAEVALASRGFSPFVGSGEVENKDTDSAAWKETGLWSAWMLWDHRYWIRVRTENAEALSQIRIRPYSESDAQRLCERLPKTGSKLQSILAEAAPGKLRYTIPVLTKEGQVSVFPTLNVTVEWEDSMDVKPKLTDRPTLEWEVCYKVIDHPFISEQRETIEWRNAQGKRRTRAGSSCREARKQVRKSTANEPQRIDS
ncbi:tRNA(Ile)-lysidine synthetase [Cladophialophora bantiana CBS 173.52]|uniref:tRNA(Ile)-lysidine synthetase n=1 Tax=Cladophialophora bantiana (strain ATCC 10958 / CBS 173.52 / CDC B-1940 / NIH 8579) TaxID=1442370 RepID=A0A0D2FL93_CLAB1|nr:tRNA(Ile)-lysidine synthetase [Cladophialophora bantiana CBS 173.52]KIW87462.1 tRNA(Ile)-lysidine synthetase [Cladophialophora bantiana CBS 173.52]